MGTQKEFEITGDTLYRYNGAAATVIIPEGVEIIDEYAFKDTPAKKIVLPTTLVAIDSRAFEGCELEYNEHGGALYLGCEGNDYFLLCKAKDKKIAECRIHPQTVIIGSCAFQDCVELVDVEVPDSVKYVGAYAFAGCDFEEIDLPLSVEVLGDGCFSGSSIKSFVLPPEIAIINDFLFSGCSDLKRVLLHEDLEWVGSYAFEECTSLELVDLGKNVTKIEMGAFVDCKSLKKVTDTGSLEIIEDEAFYGCTALEKMDLRAVKEIGDNAFKGCKSLEEVKLGGGLTAVGSNAFADGAPKKLLEFYGDKKAWKSLEKGCIKNSAMGKYKVRIIK